MLNIELTPEFEEKLKKMTPEEQSKEGEKDGKAFLDAFVKAVCGEDDVKLPEHIASVTYVL